MTAALMIRRDRTPAVLRKAARVETDARIARRILAIANALDGMIRDAAARAAGMDRQTLRDWVIRYNAHGLDGLLGIVALGYPLHPPGRPDKPRTEHLPSIRVPVLIVQGERDTFGTPDELKPVIATMKKTKVTLHVVAGGDHSLAVRGRQKDAVFEGVLDVVARWMRENRPT